MSAHTSTSYGVSARYYSEKLAQGAKQVFWIFFKSPQAASWKMYEKDIDPAIIDRYEQIDSDLFAALLARIDRRPDERLSIRLTVLGETEAGAKPFIIVFCERHRVRAVHHFLKSDVARSLCQPTDPTIPSLEVHVIPHPPLSRNATAIVEVYSPSPPSLKRHGYSETLCGTPIRLECRGKQQFSTFGGMLKVTNQDGVVTLYGMTAGHVTSTLSGVQAGDMSMPYSVPSSSYSRAHNTSTKSEVGTQMASIECPVPGRSKENFSDQYNEWDKVGYIYSTQDPKIVQLQNKPYYDWALIKINGNLDIKPNRLIEATKHAKSDDHPILKMPDANNPGNRKRRAVTMMSASGIKSGFLSAVKSSITVGFSQAIVKTFLLKLGDGNAIVDGDSGSWVVDTTSHEVCGYIVASDVFGEAYVIPFMDGLESIKQELGASCVELMDPSDIAPQRIELAPLIDPTARNREQISHAEQEKEIEHVRDELTKESTEISQATIDPLFSEQLKNFTLRAIDGREFVRVKKMTEWLRSIDPETGMSHFRRLLQREVDFEEFLSYRRLFSEEPAERMDLTFCILLSIGQGRLLNLFREHRVVDRTLPVSLSSLTTEFTRVDELPTKWREIAEAFHKIQWKFIPVVFDVVSAHYTREFVLPIHKREPLTDQKGGTARLYHIEVLEEFLSSELRHSIESSQFDDKRDDLGPRYRIVQKVFGDKFRDVYHNEVKTFRTLQPVNSRVLRYLGSFRNEYRRTDDVTLEECNILLEYGDYDLDEFFNTATPPSFPADIWAFWKNMFGLADAVDSIHNLRVEIGGRDIDAAGWHADIKPSNILCVGGQFKLADPGFAIVMSQSKEPRAVMQGGTRTYGAPEIFERKSAPVSQGIDIWSLGCVFSIAATWVVLGSPGVKTYEQLRRRAVRRIAENEFKSGVTERFEAPIVSGFHDGHDVLREILDWHQILRQLVRKIDDITSGVLDLIDDAMLVMQNQRMSSAALRKQCQSLLLVCKPRLLPASRDTLAILESIGTEESRARPVELAVVQPGLGIPTFMSQPLLQPTPQPTLPVADISGSYSTVGLPVMSLSLESAASNLGLNLLSPDSVDFSRAVNPPTSLRTENVFMARAALRERQKKPLNIIKHSRDKELNEYLADRDMVFLVDNSETMRAYWSEARDLLEVLAYKCKDTDMDGIDLMFTCKDVELRSTSKVSKLLEAMQQPDARPRPGMETDIVEALDRVFRRYSSINAKPAGKYRTIRSVFQPARERSRFMTIIIFTDGVWSLSPPLGEIERFLANSIRTVARLGASRRSVTIQFIRFGDESEAIKRLQILDKELSNLGSPDVIDVEPARGDVYKMLLGSLSVHDTYDTENQSSVT